MEDFNISHNSLNSELTQIGRREIKSIVLYFLGALFLTYYIELRLCLSEGDMSHNNNNNIYNT
jgi:hypothetical protein